MRVFCENARVHVSVSNPLNMRVFGLIIFYGVKSFLTQSVDETDAEHIEAEQGVIDSSSALMIHKDVIENRPNSGRQAS